MKNILIIALLCASCSKQKPAPTEKSLFFIGFRNLTTHEINFNDGCEANIVQSGVTKYVYTTSNDTICSFKLDDAGVISWRSYPGHVVTLGGCTVRSLTIHQ
ncbi:MAG TPA: hypothetical protein VIM65_22305 [Cyclobacteriaceae bacterium]